MAIILPRVYVQYSKIHRPCSALLSAISQTRTFAQCWSAKSPLINTRANEKFRYKVGHRSYQTTYRIHRDWEEKIEPRLDNANRCTIYLQTLFYSLYFFIKLILGTLQAGFRRYVRDGKRYNGILNEETKRNYDTNLRQMIHNMVHIHI
jgi:hypothetical protein